MDDFYKRDLLVECQRVHASVTGSGDPLDPSEMAQVAGWLLRRKRMWRHSSSAYESAVYAILRATLDDIAHAPKARDAIAPVLAPAKPRRGRPPVDLDKRRRAILAVVSQQDLRSFNGVWRAVGGDKVTVLGLAKELLHYNDDGRLVARLGFNAQD